MCKAIEEMIEDGRSEGRIEMLIQLVKDNVIDVSIAASESGMTKEEFLEFMNQY